MKVLTKLAKDKYAYNKNSDTHLLIELTAPKVEMNKDRAPICVIPVLDVSGSMRGSKLDYVQKACRKLFDHLSPGDYAGLVAFDSNVYDLARPQEVTQTVKDNLKNMVSKLRVGSATNTSGGLLTALNWINETDLPANTVLRVILFTDGHSNTGVAVGDQLLSFLEERKGRASVSCFGFGNGCAQDLLAGMSDMAQGNYAFIDSPDAALSAFGRELGGLMSTYAQNINITLTSEKNQVLEILNDEDVEDENGKTVIKLRDILGEEQKFIVAKVRLNEVSSVLPRAVNAFGVSVSWVDKDGKDAECSETTKVRFCKANEELEDEDEEVTRHRDRLLAAQAQTKAEVFAAAGDFRSAQVVLTSCADMMTDQKAGGFIRKISENYANANSFTKSRGATTSALKYMRGKRVSSADAITMNDVSDCFSYSVGNTAMGVMESNFVADKEEEEENVTPSVLAIGEEDET